MANSKYEYVKSFEVQDEVMPPNLVLVRIKTRDFRRFSQVHEFEVPNDEKALNLMNSCATAVLEEYPDIVFAYGFCDEYSFIFKKQTKFYQRRGSKILSLIVSFFTSVYATKWKDFFPHQDLRYPPSFQSHIICCASMEVLQRAHSGGKNSTEKRKEVKLNLPLIIFSQVIAETNMILVFGCWSNVEMLKGTQKQEKNELLFQRFGINYKKLPNMFRQGSCVLKTEASSLNLFLLLVEEIVKYNDNDTPVIRPRRKVIIIHLENIAARNFWNAQLCLVKELGCFRQEMNKIKPEYVKSFQFENKLMPFTWIVVRIDGCHFHRFSEVHQFEKPNDEQALNLMNSCAVAVVEELNDVVFAYGVSDEYSFVLKKDSELYQRRASDIVSAVVSLFTSIYVMRWKEFFPQKDLKYSPYFDGRAVCYPSSTILRDYLAWRQVDCHINNQYNTCFWMLVKSGKRKIEAQSYLKGTQTKEKNELLIRQFGIAYDTLPVMFRLGSSIFQDE
ncbi:hypothetical protein RJ639_023532, partial [Escallonia herrerae]